ncbi:hypothetical protein LINGRAHAP2_LOCUS22474 [Linum grandiflorum]
MRMVFWFQLICLQVQQPKRNLSIKLENSSLNESKILRLGEMVLASSTSKDLNSGFKGKNRYILSLDPISGIPHKEPCSGLSWFSLYLKNYKTKLWKREYMLQYYLILFSEANTHQATVILHILDTFCATSGQMLTRRNLAYTSPRSVVVLSLLPFVVFLVFRSRRIWGDTLECQFFMGALFQPLIVFCWIGWILSWQAKKPILFHLQVVLLLLIVCLTLFPLM